MLHLADFVALDHRTVHHLHRDMCPTRLCAWFQHYTGFFPAGNNCRSRSSRTHCAIFHPRRHSLRRWWLRQNVMLPTPRPPLHFSDDYTEEPSAHHHRSLLYRPPSLLLCTFLSLRRIVAVFLWSGIVLASSKSVELSTYHGGRGILCHLHRICSDCVALQGWEGGRGVAEGVQRTVGQLGAENTIQADSICVLGKHKYMQRSRRYAQYHFPVVGISNTTFASQFLHYQIQDPSFLSAQRVFHTA